MEQWKVGVLALALFAISVSLCVAPKPFQIPKSSEMLWWRSSARSVRALWRSLAVCGGGGGGGDGVGGGGLREDDVQEIRVPVPWGHIAGRWWGRRDAAPLVAVHGIECNAASFDALAPRLRTEALLAVDLPGHGLSSPYPLGRPYYVPDDVLALRRVQLHFGWGPLSLLAHSYGSLVAFAFAALLPDAAARLVCVECARVVPPGDYADDLEHAAAAVRRLPALEAKMAAGEGPAYSARALAEAFRRGARGAVTEAGAAAMLARGREPAAPGGEAFRFRRDPRLRLAPLGRPSPRALLQMAAAIRCHHLHIRATRGFMRTRAQIALYERTLRLMRREGTEGPEGRVYREATVEGAHFLHIDSPDSVAPLINDFLLRTSP